MKKFILIFACASLCFNGCKKDVVPPPDPGIGVENTVRMPYSSTYRVSSTSKVEDTSGKISPEDTVRLGIDQCESGQGNVE